MDEGFQETRESFKAIRAEMVTREEMKELIATINSRFEQVDALFSRWTPVSTGPPSNRTPSNKGPVHDPLGPGQSPSTGSKTESTGSITDASLCSCS